MYRGGQRNPVIDRCVLRHPRFKRGCLHEWMSHEKVLSCGSFLCFGGVFMSIIQVRNLTFGYDGSYDNVFENSTFELDTDWKLGLIGRNGCGKTTFLNLLLGKYEYSGTISAGVSFDYFPFAVENQTQRTAQVIGEIYAGYEGWQVKREFSLLRLSEEILDRPFGTLSNGEKTKVLLAALFLKENGFLLIDEPTNHLDETSRALIGDYLNRKSGFILVSHDRTFLDHCIDHVLSINRMDMDIQQGNFSSWWQNKQWQDNARRQQNEKLKKDIDRLSVAAKRTADWSENVEKSKYSTRNSGIRPDRGYVGHKAAKMMKRSKNLLTRQQAAMEEKAGLLQNIEQTESLKILPLSDISGALFSCENLSLRYGERVVAQNIRCSLESGDRIAVRGKNGCGKTTLLRLLCGEDSEYDGVFFKNSRLRISYVPQDTNFLRGALTDYARERKVDESLFKAILRKLGFAREQFEKDMSDFSAGQKKKVLIAKSLSERAHVYVWDEPLNYIDVFSRIQIEELLLTYRPTLVFVEHDSAFCTRISTGYVNIGNE